MRRLCFQTMLELICAVALLALLSACFFASLKTVRDADVLFTSENRAQLVLDNTVERLAGMRRFTDADLDRIFSDELAKSCLAGNPKFKAEIRREGSFICPAIMKQNGKAWAEVKIK